MKALPVPFSSLPEEFRAARVRTRRTFAVSVGAHALILLVLVTVQTLTPPPPGLTEITWIDPEALEMASVIPEKVKEEIKKPALPVRTAPASPAPQPAHFERAEQPAEVNPKPQTTTAVTDRLNERLSTLQERAAVVPAQAPAVLTANMTARPTTGLATPSTVAPAKLTRGQPVASTPLEMRRSSMTRNAPLAAVTPTQPREKTPAKADVGNANAQKTLAGATLLGPVADRPLVTFQKPVYPEWAKQEAVEATVRLYFVVLSDGRVKENIQVRKTAGFQDFDKNAEAALLAWRFEPLPSGTVGEQWGEITFYYRLN